MKNEKTSFFPLLLGIISACVVVALSMERNAWGWILAYWIVIAIKNSFDMLDS